ncbi:unnamed protein product [Brachionus calyciflorus]|uniref:P-type domain-containing protein n=1 Tax=Brachionus calyciflorus TaxID=104777 RepID=A0A813U538_9BILA|nr:unnamed protein product [Brachionus calyciflorus]
MLKICIFLLIFNQLVIFAAWGANLQCDKISNIERFDCFPEYGSNQVECERRGCCWSPPIGHKKLTNDMDTPYCFFPKDFPNYSVVDKQTQSNTLTYTIEKQNSTFRPNEILKLQVKITFDTKTRLRVQITDPSKHRFQVPIFNREFKAYPKLNNIDETDYQIYINDNPFYIKIIRKSNGKAIFDSSVAPLIYADQYIQFSTRLINNIFYGIGEHQDSLSHEATWNRYTFWNRDIAPTINTNLYGTHPFYMSLDKQSNAMGFYLLNSNGMDINVNPTPALTFITIGGIVDFYVYLGPSPSDVIAQHTELIGRSQMPQYFTLGFHLCRWGYFTSDKLYDVIKRNRAIGIPYDVQWTDIDAMSERLDWTYDKQNFTLLPEIVRDLHEHGQYYVNIIDPAISNTPNYYPYESGVKQNVFIKQFDKDEPLIGVVWPGTTAFPDFTNPNTTQWWLEQASNFYDIIKYDGLWIDMNEPSNFVDGSINGCLGDRYDEPPYVPRVLGGALNSRTVCASSQQYLSSHYNLHNMYGHFEAIATYHALRSIQKNKRPFILTRSSFGGTGQYAAHWSGDNRATWEDLYYSIPNMLSFNMFGISQVGSDICGFSGDTSEELCVRWMQLGSFYPFMRNHNDDVSKDQDPAVFSKVAQDIMKKALMTRYALLPYFYNLFYKSNQFGETVVRPLFFEFPNDLETHEIDRQFLVGPALLVTPVLNQGEEKVNGYFPNETWYDYKSGDELKLTKGEYLTLEAPITDTNVHVRGGHIIPYQHPSQTTKQSRKNPFGLLVALKQNATSKFALGSMYWDDGESLDSIDTKNYNYFNFLANENGLIGKRVVYGYESRMILSDLKVYGLDKTSVSQVLIDGQFYDNFDYDSDKHVLRIKFFNVNMLLKDTFDIIWS